MPQQDLDGLVALVTGAASGIGRAAARRLAAGGATVAGLDLSWPDSGPAEAADDLALRLTADLRRDTEVRAAVARTVDRLGRLDVVVANAGVGASGTVEDHDDEEWRAVLDVNLLGTVRVLRAALPHLRASPSAAVVVTGSVVADVGLPQRALYSASKGALHALVRAMAADHLADGVRVNAVVPGTADTPWVARLLRAADDPAAARAALEQRQPLGRLVSADEVAEAVVYLAGPAAASTTGVLLPVDGGLTGLRLPPRR